MDYVERLRVAKVLKIVLMILAAVVALAVITRFMQDGPQGRQGPGPAPGTVPVVTHGADGTVTTTYTDVHGAHVVLRELPDGNFSYRSTKNVPGSDSVVVSRSGDDRIPLAALLLIASFAAALVGSIFGLTLSRENDGHLELAWTKPASRDTYALRAVAADVSGILMTGLLVIACALVCLVIEGAGGLFYVGTGLPQTLLFCLLFPLSVYALTLAATASLRRGAMFFAIFWPVALLFPNLTRLTWMNLGTIARALDALDPVAYFYAFASSSPVTASLLLPLPAGTAMQFAALAAICALCLVASLAQWRRLEA